MFSKLIKPFNKLFKLALSHKLIAGIIILVILFGGYFGYKAIRGEGGAVRYITAVVEKGTLITSISGSGQVSASDQIDIKSKVSDDIAAVYVVQGQEVKTGALLVQIDSRDAQKAVRDAETSLETARLELDKLLEPVDELDLLKAENNLAQAKESKQKAEDNIVETYEDAFNAIANAFLDLPTLITALRDILYSEEIADNEPAVLKGSTNMSAFINSVSSKYYDDRHKLEEFIDTAENDYKTARIKYNENFENYRNTSRYSEYDIIEALLEEALETSRAIAETVKSEINMIDFWVDYRSRKDLRIFKKVTEYQSDLKSHTLKINSHLSSLLNIQRSIQDSKEDVLNAQRLIEELELSFAELKAGADELDIRAKKITVQQKEDALFAAQENLANCYIRALFDGIVAEIYIKKGDSVSSGTKLLTLVSKQKLAEITLNEIDVAKVENGQPTTLIFDAVENLTLTGKVVEIDTLGTTTQGVVTYGVKIAFDTQDERIKPGMTVDASIVAERRDSVFLVPNAAVQMQGGQIFVEILQNEIPQSVLVEVGLSNEISTEIIRGLSEGVEVVIARLEGESNIQNTANTGQSFRIPGMGGSSGRTYRGGGFMPH